MKKTKKTTIALSLTLTFASMLVALPMVTAHDPPWTIPTITYLVASPDPIGVGQQVIVVFWLNSYPPTAAGAYGDRWQFTVEITKPDGTKETFGPITSDPIGTGYTLFTLDQVGTYT